MKNRVRIRRDQPVRQHCTPCIPTHIPSQIHIITLSNRWHSFAWIDSQVCKKQTLSKKWKKKQKKTKNTLGSWIPTLYNRKRILFANKQWNCLISQKSFECSWADWNLYCSRGFSCCLFVSWLTIKLLWSVSKKCLSFFLIGSEWVCVRAVPVRSEQTELQFASAERRILKISIAIRTLLHFPTLIFKLNFHNSLNIPQPWHCLQHCLDQKQRKR